MENQIKVTFGALNAASPALGRLLAIKQPQKTVYHVAKLVKLVQAELTHFEEKREALIREYGVERKPTDAEVAQRGAAPIVEITDPENMKKFMAEFTELAAVEVELPWRKIKFADLADFEVSAADVLGLEPLLSFDDDSDTPAL